MQELYRFVDKGGSIKSTQNDSNDAISNEIISNEIKNATTNTNSD
jgi:hypothetical protein